MAEMIRTFLAVELPEETRLALEGLQGSLRGELPGLRWTAPEQLHLTLAFLGNVPGSGLDRLGDAVAEAASASRPFELALEGLGAFPSPSKARVLWVGAVGGALAALDDLQRAVALAARRAGCPPADDRFHPHVTIARSKSGRGPAPDLVALCDRLRQYRVGPLPVASVVTFASELTPSGPIYSPMRSEPLIGPSP